MSNKIINKIINENKFYRILFVYQGKYSQLRYIPVQEGNKCYFKVCGDEKCPVFKNNIMHPEGMKGCSSGWNICENEKCELYFKHLVGCHKRCIGNKGKQKLPEFADRCIVSYIPSGKNVYHFNKEDFNRN